MREFGKISTGVWKSKRFSKLQPVTGATRLEAKALYCYLHTNRHANSIGCYSLPAAYIAHDLGVDTHQIGILMGMLSDVDLIHTDPDADDLVYIVDFLNHTPLTNPNHAYSGAKIAVALPESELKQRVINELCSGPHGEGLSEKIAKLYPSHTHQDAYRNKEREIETEKEIDKDKSQSKVDRPNVEVYKTSAKGKKISGKILEDFLLFWEAFSYRNGKAQSAEAWRTIPDYSPELAQTIIQAAKVEAQGRKKLVAEGRTPKMAQGWLTDRRWENEGMVDATKVSQTTKALPAATDELTKEWEVLSGKLSKLIGVPAYNSWFGSVEYCGQEADYIILTTPTKLVHERLIGFEKEFIAATGSRMELILKGD